MCCVLNTFHLFFFFNLSSVGSRNGVAEGTLVLCLQVMCGKELGKKQRSMMMNYGVFLSTFQLFKNIFMMSVYDLREGFKPPFRQLRSCRCEF